MTQVQDSRRRGPRAVRRRRPADGPELPAVVLLVAGVAGAVRLAALLRSGGLHGVGGIYDDGVYYAAASAASFGRVPYKAFVLLHPPGVVWALLPFAELGRFTSDATGMAAARLAWVGIGALNSALVTVATRRFGVAAAGVAGLFYATWPHAVQTETRTVLEPLVSLALLAGLTAMAGPRFADRHRLQVAAGVALGLAPTVKIWAVVPVLVSMTWFGLRYGRRVAVRMVLAAAGAAAAACGPFLALAPGDMPRMVVLDQLGRARSSDRIQRLWTVSGLDVLVSPHPGRSVSAGAAAAVTVTVLVLLASAALAWRSHLAALFVALTAADLGVLLLAPSFFQHYAAFVVPTFALALGAAVGLVLHRARHPRGAPSTRSPGSPPGPMAVVAARGVTVAVLALSAAGLTGLAEASARLTVTHPFPRATLAPAVAGARCVTADAPEALIALDVLSRDLRRGCRVMIDVSGLTYDRDALPLRPDGTAVRRRLNARWQTDLMAYLSSGDAAMILRARADDFSPGSRRQIRRWEVLADRGGYRVYRPTRLPGAAPSPGASPTSGP